MSILIILIGGLVLLLVPYAVTDSFLLNALILVFLFGTVAQAWNILGGYAGQLSFGHAVFFGIGAYTSTLLLSRYGIVPWVGAPIGAAVALALSQVIGYATFRLRRHFFALATLALGEIARISFLNWRYVGAAIGLYLPLQYRGSLVYVMWDVKQPYYTVAFILFAAAIAATALIDRSRMGIYLKAINHDEDAAQAFGLDPLRYKQWAMGTSAAFTALAGSLYAQFVLYIDPYNVMSARISLLVVVIALIGGRGTIWGPVLGGAFIILLTEYSRVALGKFGGGYDFALLGLLVMLVALFEPKGLVGLVQRMHPRVPFPLEGAATHPGLPPRPRGGATCLTIVGMRKHFGGLVALDDVNLTVQRGEILGLVGPNGAGKSTLFDCISGFQRPDGGTVHLADQLLTGAPAHLIARRGLVRTFQLIRIFPDLTVAQNLLVAQPHGGERVWHALRKSEAPIEDRVETLLRQVELSAYRDSPAAALSYGQQKLLSLGMGLMSEATILFLDEPTAGVNPRVIDDLIGVIRDANAAGQTFVIIEHNMAVIDALAHRVYFMADGRILAEGSPADLRTNPIVLEAYYGR